jgi:hypothetical protein
MWMQCQHRAAGRRRWMFANKQLACRSKIHTLREICSTAPGKGMGSSLFWKGALKVEHLCKIHDGKSRETDILAFGLNAGRGGGFSSLFP